MSESDIIIRGAREHNLRNVSVRLPRNSLIVMTGVSGSGKSSLAFDTLYAEGQRRYVESLSSYARQFLGQMPKPEVDAISGWLRRFRSSRKPAVAIPAVLSARSPRFTTTSACCSRGSGTGFARSADSRSPHRRTSRFSNTWRGCPRGRGIRSLRRWYSGKRGVSRPVRGPVEAGVFASADRRKNPRAERSADARQADAALDRRGDRPSVGGSTARSRLAEAVEQALRMGKGRLIVLRDGSVEAPRAVTEPPPADGSSRRRAKVPLPEEADEDRPLPPSDAEQMFGTDYACIPCGLSFEPPTPQLFSFNSPQGMCTDCHGLGQRHEFDLAKLIPDDSLSFAKGAVELVGPLKGMGRWRRHIYQGVMAALEKENGPRSGGSREDGLAGTAGIDSPRLVVRLGRQTHHLRLEDGRGDLEARRHVRGDRADPVGRVRQAKNPMRRRQIEKYLTVGECSSCGGTRLNRHARSVRLTSTARSEAAEVVSPPAPAKKAKAGTRSAEAPPPNNAPWRLSLAEVCGLTIADASRFFEDLQLDDTRRFIAGEVLKEIRGRLGFLRKCGLDYLTLDRSAPTLSGGESQRIRLAGQIGCGLVGVVYIPRRTVDRPASARQSDVARQPARPA